MIYGGLEVHVGGGWSINFQHRYTGVLGMKMEPTPPCFCLLPVIGICLQLHGLTWWHCWTLVMKDRSALWTAVSTVICEVAWYSMSKLFGTSLILIHTLCKVFLLVVVWDYTLCLGCREPPLQFQSLQSLKIPSFRFCLPPVSIGLQISLMLSVFYSKLEGVVWGFIALTLTFRKLCSCLLYWFLVFRTLVHSSSWLPGFKLVSVIWPWWCNDICSLASLKS